METFYGRRWRATFIRGRRKIKDGPPQDDCHVSIIVGVSEEAAGASLKGWTRPNHGRAGLSRQLG